jgi:hypothetical protein
MKTLLPILATSALLASCAQQSAPPTVTTGMPYATYQRSNDLRVPVTTAYRSWTTEQLQKRRIDLYYTVPQRYSRQGVAEYITDGMPLPQQDEIRAIEAELNRRYRAGDTSALLQTAWPESRRHSS